jgi:alkaline phosphatase
MQQHSRSVFWVLVALAAAAVGCDNPAPKEPRPKDAGSRPPVDAAIRDAEQPEDAAADAARDAATPAEPRLARNIIIFMGDGMGAEQLATGRHAKEGRLRLDVMAGPALARTDSLTTHFSGGPNAPPTDSAAAATVIATGRLVENDVLSLGPNGEKYETLLEVAKRLGKATGLVTTSTFFDASPAAFAAHQTSRSLYPEIVTEILGVTQPDLVMGAGAWFVDAQPASLRELIEQSGYTILRGAAELAAWDIETQPRILGLFDTNFVPAVAGAERFTMTPEMERSADSPDPTLSTMTRRAIDRLSKAPDGFFLFAEDEIFDQMSHRGPAEVEWANRALPRQAIAFDAAVAVALDWVVEHSSFDETLIVVLADHETGGYRFDHAVGPESGEFTSYWVAAGGLRVGEHTRTPIEVYALGPGSDAVPRITQHADTYRLLLGVL